MTAPVSELPAMEVADRLARLRPLVTAAEADSLLVTTLANIRYLTGFTGSAALLLITEDDALLVTDGRYRTQAAEQLEAVGVARSVDLVVGGVSVQRDAIVGRVGPEERGRRSRPRMSPGVGRGDGPRPWLQRTWWPPSAWSKGYAW